MDPETERPKRLRVVVLTNYTSQLSLPVLRSLHASELFEIPHVLLYDSVAASKGRIASIVRKQGLTRTVTKAGQILRAKIASMLPGTVGSMTHCRFSRDYIARHAISATRVRTVNDRATIDLVSRTRPDFLLCCSFGERVRSVMLAIPRLAAVNVHASLLPHNRGPQPSFWALYHNEETSGITFHLMRPELDEGPILKQFPLSIDHDWSEDELTHRLFQLAGSHVADVLVGFADGQYTAVPQDESLATYHSFPTLRQRAELDRRRRKSRR